MYHRQKMEKENDLNKAEKIEYSVENEDIVISGLGFIKIKKAAKVDIYHLPNLKIFKRKSLI